ncbi:unnamed protein product [Musa hybrid cultivar]
MTHQSKRHWRRWTCHVQQAMPTQRSRRRRKMSYHPLVSPPASIPPLIWSAASMVIQIHNMHCSGGFGSTK